VGRRHLIRLAAALAVAFAAAASAGAADGWRVVADGPGGGGAAPPVAFVATARPATSRFAARLPEQARAAVSAADFSQDALVAIFGEFGCRDSQIVVSSLAQHGGVLAVTLAQKLPAAGRMTCMAIFPTYRLLLVPKTQLQRPFPTRATVTLARA